MNSYKTYFDNQTISPGAHNALLALYDAVPAKTAKRPAIRPIAAMAACCAILAGLGIYGLRGGTAGPNEPLTPIKNQENDQSKLDVIQGQSHNFFMVPYIEYPLSQYDGLAIDGAMRIYEEGSFYVELGREAILTLIGGKNAPALLGWEGYELSGSALYHNDGALSEIFLSGKNGDDWMNIRISPKSIPFDCGMYGWDEAVTEVRGVKVTAYREEDENRTLYHSAFMAGDLGIGATFNSAAGDPTLSSIFITWAAGGGLDAEALMTNNHIPAWDAANLSSLAEARAYEQFAPYLPTSDPVKGFWDCSGGYSYQEGVRNRLSIYWSKGYDDVNIRIILPEGETETPTPVDINNPASYDTRLYEIPWCDSVPKEYILDFSSPLFRAEDMSLEIVKARQVPHDTGGYCYDFDVLHANGVIVEYRFDGMSAEDIWAVIAPTTK